MELTGFSRFNLKGDGAADWLASLVTGNLPRVGRIGLVYFASAKGKVLTEMSATRLAEDEFLLITGAGAYWHDRDLLNQYLPNTGHITLTDTTRDYATLLVTGPKSPAIIAAASGISTAQQDFPWLSCQSCEVAGCVVTTIRVSYAGEAGWEIHCDMADVVAVYDAIMAAGAPHQLGHFGMLALDSMRLEKGYRSWKSDLTSDYTMLESGLGHWVKFEKDDFIGRAPLQAEHQAGSQRQFVMLTLDDPVDGNADPFGEAVYLSVVQCDGVDSGLVVSSGYGHRVDKSISMAVVDTDKLASASQITVTVLGRPRAAHLASAHALYDPNNEKLRG